MPLAIRLATESDLDAIGAIFNYYIERSTCTFHLEPQSAADYLAWFRGHGELHPVTVAERDDRVIGWASLSPWRPREAYARSVEGSIYVHNDHLREGIGRTLLEDMIGRARALGHRTLIGGACTEQEASLALQEAFGFERVGTFKQVGRKFDRWLDVAHTQLML